MCKAVGDNDLAKRHCEDALEYFVKVEKKRKHRHREEQLKRCDKVVLNNFVAAQTSNNNETVQDDDALPRNHLRTQMVLFANDELLLMTILILHCPQVFTYCIVVGRVCSTQSHPANYSSAVPRLWQIMQAMPVHKARATVGRCFPSCGQYQT
jgi:hypothetical protein